MTPLVVHLVPGTWSRGAVYALRTSLRAAFPFFRVPSKPSIWVDDGSQLCRELEAPNRTFKRFEWSGSNSFAARKQAAKDFASHLQAEVSRAPHASHVIIAHSHGGNIALESLRTHCDTRISDAVKLAVTIATPFLINQGSAHPRIRSVLTLGRPLALLLWVVFPVLFWATGFFPGWTGMITPFYGLMLLWSSSLIIFVASSFLLTSERGVRQLLGLALAVAFVGFVVSPADGIIAAAAGEEAVQSLIPHFGAMSTAACLMWFLLAWRSSVKGAEALRDTVRIALLIGVPTALIAHRLVATDMFQVLAWDAGAMAILPSFSAATGLSCVALLRRRTRDGMLATRPLLVRVLAVRLPGDEASFAINAAQIVERLGGFIYRWRYSAVPAAVVAVLLSPLFFLIGFGLVASAAYGGFRVIGSNIIGPMFSVEQYRLALTFSLMVLASMLPLVSLAANLPLCVGVGPEILFGLSTQELSCRNVPESGNVSLDVVPLGEHSAGLHHSAYNHPAVRQRIVAELQALEAFEPKLHAMPS